MANGGPTSETIFLASGVSLGRGLIVTFCTAPISARFRATLHDGQQADAELRVADDYSGLRLIEVANRELPSLELASESPKLGAPVMSAAAMGLETPLVSLGIVSGADYLPAGVELPPLLVCDVRSVETSSGGPVVNREGKLVGIVAATSNAAQKPGWTYAIPARHVLRLVQAKADNQIVLLRRQRPVAGFTLGAGAKDGVVRVERVETGGPAERAGIKPGDVLLEADGRKIRSAYQAIDLILRKQPGDRVPLVVEQSGDSKSVTMMLAGTTSAQTYGVDPSFQVGPQVNVTMVPPDKIEVRRNIGPAPTASLGGQSAQTRSAQDEVAALKAQLAETNNLIESMTSEISRLRKRLETKEE
jgi:S1-C subfamily serine protease